MTVEVEAPKYSPAYNNRYIVLSSTNTNKSRFKYVVQVFDGSTEVARINQPPDIDGNGVIEISNILKNFVGLEPNILVNNSDNGGNHFYNFNLKYGEMYVSNWLANEISDNNGNIQLSTDGFSDVEHDYSEGDLINLDSPSSSYALSGVYRVIDVVDNKTIVINQDFLQANTTLNYDTEYTDQRTTDFLDLANQSDRYIYDARLLFDENANYNQNDYKIGTSDGLMLTGLQNLVGEIPITQTDKFTANYFGTLAGSMQLEVEILEPTVSSVNISINTHIGTVGLGYQEIVDNFPPVTINKYRVRLDNTTTGNTTPWITFKIVDNCSKFENKKLIWMDRFGAWNSFNFELHSTRDIQSNKTVYQRENIGSFDGTNYTVDTERYGDLVTKVNYNESFTVNSGRLTQNQIFMLEDLFTSRYVYELDGENLIPLILESNNYQISSLLHDRMRTLSVTYRRSNKNQR